MKFRGGEFPTGTTGNFQPELTNGSLRTVRKPKGVSSGCSKPCRIAW